MPDLSSVKRLLIYRLGSLGDTVVALPSLHLIARSFPNAERRLLTNLPVESKAAPAAAVLEHSGLVHGYLHYRVGERNLRNLLRLRAEIRAWRPDAVVYLAAYRGRGELIRDWIFFRVCGIGRLYGFPFKRDQQQPRRLLESGELEHESSRLVRAIAEVFGDPQLDSPASWDLHLTAAEKAVAGSVLEPAEQRPILAVCVGTKVQAKDWGAENWQNLLSRLAPLYPGYALVMVGANDEREVSDKVATGWQEYAGKESVVLNLCGQLTPRESAAVLAQAKLYLGHDSGPMHLAAAVGTRCVAVFAARNIPVLWYPHGAGHRVLYHQVDCAGCGLSVCVEQKKKCILSITMEEVVAEVQSVLPTSLPVHA
jgi:ADP-heptose:LPS heptosyltransferase